MSSNLMDVGLIMVDDRCNSSSTGHALGFKGLHSHQHVHEMCVLVWAMGLMLVGDGQLDQ